MKMLAGRLTKGFTTAGLACVAASGCFASKSDVDQLRDEMSTLRAETSSVDSARALQMAMILSTLRSVNDTLAALGTRVTRVRAESLSGMRDMHDELQQIQEATGQSQQRLQEMRAAIEQHNRTAPLPPPPTVRGAPGSHVTPATPDTTLTATDAPGPNELFQLGRTQLARGGNSAARAAFTDLLKRFPDSDLAADAQFYLAETLAAEGNASAADTAYATVVTRYPTSLRAATALYKRGVAQQKAGKTATAKQTFSEIIRLFPDSDEAALARERLRAMS
jgi:tol-pal system protein YbgF